MTVDPPPVSHVSEKVEVRPSPIQGRGLFATAPIAAGEVIAVIGGTLMDDAEFAAYARGRVWFSAMAVGEGLNLVQAPGDPAALGNHSCDPNMWMADAITEVARRPVAAGEELTTDYALTTVHEDWSMPCRCGRPVCRGIVTGADWKLPELQHRYRGRFSPFIAARIDQDAAER